MKFVQRLVKFSEAKDLIQKQAAQVKAGTKDLAEPLKKNLELIEMYKGLNENGVIDPDMVLPVTVEEKVDPAQAQADIMSGIDWLKTSVEKLLGMAKAAPMAKADDETRYMLQSMIYKFRDRMVLAQSALDQIEFAKVSAAAESVQGGAMAKADFAKLLDFDSMVAEVGKEVVEKVDEKVIEAVSKMLKADGEGDGGEAGGDDTPPTDEAAGGGDDAAPEGDTDAGGDGNAAPEGDGETGAGDAGEEPAAGADDKPEENNKGDEEDDDDDGRDPSVDLSPPLSDPRTDDGDDFGDLEIEGA